jgi:cell division protein FtsB
MGKLIDFFNKIRNRINKYYFTIAIFFVLAFCIGDSTLYDRYLYDKKINELEKEINTYQKIKDTNIEKMEALHSDNESLERFAREQYQMTKPDEELFIITP